MKLFIATPFALVAVVMVSSRPEPPVANYLPQSYTTTQQDSFAPPPSGPSNTHGAPSALSNSYGAPSALSNSYGAPSALSNIYGAPSASGRGSGNRASFSPYRPGGSKTRFGASAPSQTYGAPAQTSAIFTPSSTYGAPSSTYGAPRLGGYPAAKYDASQNDLSEPANYEFSYQVQDALSGSDFGHHEGRNGDAAWGSYEVLLPDGRKQIVDYEADQNGYIPKIRYEETGYAASRGTGGPY